MFFTLGFKQNQLIYSSIDNFHKSVPEDNAQSTTKAVVTLSLVVFLLELQRKKTKYFGIIEKFGHWLTEIPLEDQTTSRPKKYFRFPKFLSLKWLSKKTFKLSTSCWLLLTMTMSSLYTSRVKKYELAFLINNNYQRQIAWNLWQGVHQKT